MKVTDELEIRAIPRNLYYHEIAYVRALEAIAVVVSRGTVSEELRPLFIELAKCRTKLTGE